MQKKMTVSKELQNAVVDHLLEQLPLMDVEAIKEEFIAWLEEMDFPLYKEAKNWSEVIKVFPTLDNDKSLVKGIKVRLSLQLYTSQNRYLVTIWESMNPKSREHYILCVNINWDETEQRIQKNLETLYTGSFNRSLRARHTIWAQNFKAGELGAGLYASSKAILSEELQGVPPASPKENRIEIKQVIPPDLPDKMI